MASIRQEIRRLTQEGAGPFQCGVTVEAVEVVSAGYRRVAVRGDGLAAYDEPRAADAFKIMIAADGVGAVAFPERGDDGIPTWPDGAARPALRAFTVRAYDPERTRLEFDVAVHGDGLTAAWLGAVRAGDVIGLAGMRREFHAGDGVDRHLIVGDSSAVPAIAAIIEAIGRAAPVRAYVAVAHEEDAALLPARPNVTTRVLVDPAPTGAGCPLVRAVRDGERAGGRVQAWLGAEASVVRALRGFVLDDLGVAREDLHAAAYWKAGQDAAEVDADTLRRYQRAAADGRDITDPDVADELEFEA